MEQAIDLSKFCDPHSEGTIFDMTKPFRFGNWLYATNSRLIVRVPDAGPDDGHRLQEQAAGKFWRIARPLHPWPGVEGEVPGVEACPDCADADGDLDGFDPEYETTHCKTCGGDTIVPGVDKMVGAHRIKGELDRKIRELPNVRYEEGSEVPAGVRFVFDGGEGRVMGTCDESARKFRKQLDDKLAHREKMKSGR